MKSVQLLVVVVVIATIAIANGCSLTSIVSYSNSFISLGRCFDSQFEGDFSLISLSELRNSKLDLSQCIASNDQTTCINEIRSFVKKYEDNVIIASLGNGILNEGKCDCIVSDDLQFGDCFSAVSSLKDYCQTFGEFSVSISNARVGKVKLSGNKNKDKDNNSNGNSASTSGSNNGEENLCGSAIRKVCKMDNFKSFNQTVVCLLQHASDLQYDCANVINSFFAGIFGSCAYDLMNLCSTDTTSPMQALSCLSKNTVSLSTTCRAQIEDIAGNVVPCASEASRFCSEYADVPSAMDCLSEVSDSDLSGPCKVMLQGYSKCSDNGFPGPPNRDDDQLPGGGGGNGVKPKPRPGSDDDEVPRKPKPGPGDDDQVPRKPKPGPGNGGNGGGNDLPPPGDDDQVPRKPKPMPGGGDDDAMGFKQKPKPGPDGPQRRTLRSRRAARNDQQQYQQLYRPQWKPAKSMLTVSERQSRALKKSDNNNNNNNGLPKPQPCWATVGFEGSNEKNDNDNDNNNDNESYDDDDDYGGGALGSGGSSNDDDKTRSDDDAVASEDYDDDDDRDDDDHSKSNDDDGGSYDDDKAKNKSNDDDGNNDDRREDDDNNNGNNNNDDDNSSSHDKPEGANRGGKGGKGGKSGKSDDDYSGNGDFPGPGRRPRGLSPEFIGVIALLIFFIVGSFLLWKYCCRSSSQATDGKGNYVQAPTEDESEGKKAATSSDSDFSDEDEGHSDDNDNDDNDSHDDNDDNDNDDDRGGGYLNLSGSDEERTTSKQKKHKGKQSNSSNTKKSMNTNTNNSSSYNSNNKNNNNKSSSLSSKRDAYDDLPAADDDDDNNNSNNNTNSGSSNQRNKRQINPKRTSIEMRHMDSPQDNPFMVSQDV